MPSPSQFYRPSPGLVSRSALVERVRSRHADVIAVAAPAGYGKSTFLAELAATDERPAAWVSLTATENDPSVLLSLLARALDAIEPVDPALVTSLWRGPSTIGSPAVQHFGAMFASRQQPFMLVLDDVHELLARDVVDALPVLVSELPPGSSIVLAGRTAPPLPLGRLRVRRRLAEIGAADLAFDTDDAAILFEQLDVDVSAEQSAKLVERTEGWPVALYLAALASRDGNVPIPNRLDEFGGDARYLAEYFGEELLDRVGADLGSFLMEASCFERLSGELCDDVLGRTGSAQLLEELRSRTLLVVPLDDRRHWYRFHRLMTDFLQAELARRDRAHLSSVHARASDWFDAHGDGDAAVSHAVLCGDLDRAEAMVSRWVGVISAAARLSPSTSRWVTMFPAEELDRRPDLMLVAALADFAVGQPGAAMQWLARASQAIPDHHPDDVSGPHGAVSLALVRAVIAPLSPAEMASEARYVYEHVGVGSGYPMSCLIRGAAAFMLGDDKEALRLLQEGADTVLERPLVVAVCLAHLAVIEAEHDRWSEATTAARRARESAGEAAQIPSVSLVVAAAAMVEAHAGRHKEADIQRRACRQQLTGLVGVAPWLNLQVRVALARTALLCGDRVEARALIDEAGAIVDACPGAIGVVEQLENLRRSSAVPERNQAFGPASLTTAELRVLQLLPTHLSVAEIAERLYVSRNTVKSQTVAIYRKLGTSSRSGAVELATAAGLLHGSGQA
jgi:LuxR family maltose regulon positive regulatory protein